MAIEEALATAPHGSAGERLMLCRVAAQLEISFSEMARAAKVSRTVMFRIGTYDVWPVRALREPIRKALRTLFAQRGATEAELDSLFELDARLLTPPPRQRGRIHGPPDQPALPPITPSPDSDPQVTDMLLPRQTLSLAARKHFALFQNPFAGEVTSAEDLFQNPETRFVREACWQAAVNASFVAVVGESGAGKTTILDDLKTRIETENRQTVLIEPSVMGMEDNDTQGKTLKSADIQTAMVMTLDPLASVAQTSEKRARQVKELLTQAARSGKQHLLIIEEAHGLPISTLKHLKRLHELMRMGLRPMLGILLLAQPELKAKLARYDTREVSQRCEVVTLQALDGDLKLYLEHRARLAGRRLEEFIDAQGIDELRARLTWAQNDKRAAPISLVYPLAVNNLMTAALNTAADLGAPLVDRNVVRAV